MSRSPENQGGTYGNDFEYQDKSKILETFDIDNIDSTTQISKHLFKLFATKRKFSIETLKEKIQPVVTTK